MDFRLDEEWIFEMGLKVNCQEGSLITGVGRKLGIFLFKWLEHFEEIGLALYWLIVQDYFLEQFKFMIFFFWFFLLEFVSSNLVLLWPSQSFFVLSRLALRGLSFIEYLHFWVIWWFFMVKFFILLSLLIYVSNKGRDFLKFSMDFQSFWKRALSVSKFR